MSYFDAEVTGLVLEIRKNTSMTYYYRYTEDYTTHTKKIGTPDTISLDEARRIILKIKKAKSSGDLENLFKPKSKAPILREFFNDYYLPYIQTYSKSWKHNRSTFIHHILPKLGDKRMDEITTPDIYSVINEVKVKKHLKNASANKVLTFIRHAYNYALDIKQEGITENPATRIKPFHEEHRERFLTKAEAKKLLKYVDQSHNTLLKYIIRFLLLTGARHGEVLRARWRDIDYINKIWIIPITKNGKIRKIPISDELLEVINQIPKKKGCEWLFPAKRTEGHYTSITAAWDYARKRARLPEVRVHDLRHSFASTLVNSGRSLYEVQRLLGHANLKMTQRYAHLNDDSLMKAASCAGKLLG